MGRNHLKRITLPKSVNIARKSVKWITKPRSGTHKTNESISLNVLLRDYLGISKNTKETKYILNKEKIKVDNKIRKDHKFPVGLMDTIEIEDLNLRYRIIYNELGKLTPLKISKEDSKIKPRKIINKKILKNKKTQINLDDGFNLLEESKEYKTNDTLIFDLANNKVKSHIKLEKGSTVYITEGNKKGMYGLVKEITKGKDLRPNIITFTKDKKDFQTRKEFAVVIGKTKPEIALQK